MISMMRFMTMFWKKSGARPDKQFKNATIYLLDNMNEELTTNYKNVSSDDVVIELINFT